MPIPSWHSYLSVAQAFLLTRPPRTLYCSLSIDRNLNTLVLITLEAEARPPNLIFYAVPCKLSSTATQNGFRRR